MVQWKLASIGENQHSIRCLFEATGRWLLWEDELNPRNLQQDPRKNGPLKTWVSSSCSKLLRGPLVRSHSIFDELNYIFEWHLTVSYYGLYWNILILEKHNLHHTGQEVFENRSSPFVVTTLPLSVAGPPKLPSVAIWKKTDGAYKNHSPPEFQNLKKKIPSSYLPVVPLAENQPKSPSK